MQSQIILKPIPQSLVIVSGRPVHKPIPLRLFSLLVLLTLSYGIIQWHSYYLTYMNGRSLSQLDHYQLIDIIEPPQTNNFEQTVLKLRLYKIFTCGYTESNILLTLCILLTMPFVLNFIEKQSSTSVAFYEFNGISIYLQILRLSLDAVQYLLTGKCICLTSGAAAVWMNLLTKITYYNLNNILASPLSLAAIGVTYTVFMAMIAVTNRVDILVSLVVALIDIALMAGGTIKFPKEVYQQKERLAEWTKLDRLFLWQKFVWNEFIQNDKMCVDSQQYFLPRDLRYQFNRE